MRNPAIGVLYALAMVAVVVAVDLLFFIGKTWQARYKALEPLLAIWADVLGGRSGRSGSWAQTGRRARTR